MIGTGNLASHLCTSLVKKGFTLKQVAGRTKAATRELASRFHAGFTTDLKKIYEDADFYFICVSDDSIKRIASVLKLKKGMLIHCSGSTSLQALKGGAQKYGVLWPLYTFIKNDVVDFSGIPLFIEGNSPAAEKELKHVASALSKIVFVMDSARREKLHLAAVMSSNFSNFLFTLADEFISREKAGKFEHLLPLIQKTVANLHLYSSLETQTGPARRGDKKIIERHLELLKKYPEQKKIYKLLTSGIKSRYRIK